MQILHQIVEEKNYRKINRKPLQLDPPHRSNALPYLVLAVDVVKGGVYIRPLCSACRGYIRLAHTMHCKERRCVVLLSLSALPFCTPSNNPGFVDLKEDGANPWSLCWSACGGCKRPYTDGVVVQSRCRSRSPAACTTTHQDPCTQQERHCETRAGEQERGRSSAQEHKNTRTQERKRTQGKGGDGGKGERERG